MESRDSGDKRKKGFQKRLFSFFILGFSFLSSIALAADTIAPSTPASLSGTADPSSTRIDVSWSASTDNVAVTAYLLERCTGSSCTNFAQIASMNYLIERCQGSGCTDFSQVGTSTSTLFTDNTLTAATNYSYRVRATDAANNLSDYSNVATAATQYSGPITYSYAYDNLGRITHASGSDGSSIDYQYDANGNVTTIQRQ